ncbi:MAG TPA: EAL domain-containing protein [Gammaproteobacteria bacterium]|nr:EAL domain-containing protein [Gammaproteobacteria bacterium]
MSTPELIDALPDLVLLVKRDGTLIAHAGGRAVPELAGRDPSRRGRFAPAWSESTAALIRQLARKTIADRAPVEARFRESGKQYDVRANPQGPSRAILAIRPALTGAHGDVGDATGEHRRMQLDRRGFLRRFKEAVSIAALRERPIAVAVIYIEEIADIAQIISTRISEQIMTTALGRLPAPAPANANANANDDGASGWCLGQLSENLLALVVESGDRDVIEACVGSVCASLREAVVIGDAEFHLTPYAGAGILGVDATSPRTLLDHARAAAAEARRAASSDVFFFSDTMQLKSLARIDIARELREAIASGAIRLRYAGRHDLRTGRRVAWVGYVRWIHPLRGEIRPAEFLRVAQTTGLATSLSRSLLAQLPEDFAALGAGSESDVRISLGALRDHVLHEDFVSDMHAFLESGAVPPERLELRIAEKVFVARHPADFRSLHQLGVRFVVDEVGRDVGSLASLARGPVWGLQLDRAWVGALRGDEVARNVCRAGIAMAAALSLTPIATGVDDEAQRDALLALGCPQGNGDLYGDVAVNAAAPAPARHSA